MKCTLLETSSIAKQYQRYTYPIRDVLAAFNGNKKLVTTFLRHYPGAASDFHLLFKHEVSPLMEPCIQIFNSICVTVDNCWTVPTIQADCPVMREALSRAKFQCQVRTQNLHPQGTRCLSFGQALKQAALIQARRLS